MNQDLWYQQTQMLVGKNLQYRLGSWERVYISIAREGTDFTDEQDYGCTLLVRVLLDIYEGPISHISRALLKACLENHTEGIKMFLSDGRANPSIYQGLCLSRALVHENREVIRLILCDKRVDVSNCPDELFLDAVSSGDERIVKMLLAAGVDASLRENEAILIAAENGFTKILYALLRQAGVDLSMDCSYAPLIKASANGRIACVSLLIRHDRSLDENHWGLHTALFRACKFGSVALVSELMKSKLDPSVCNNRALNFSREYKNSAIERVLLDDARVMSLDVASRMRD